MLTTDFGLPSQKALRDLRRSNFSSCSASLTIKLRDGAKKAISADIGRLFAGRVKEQSQATADSSARVSDAFSSICCAVIHSF